MLKLSPLTTPQGQCLCGKTFDRVPANKKHCSITCAKRDERARRAQKYKDETTAVPKVLPGTKHNPTIELLDLAAAMLVAEGVVRGEVFTGTIPEWTPKDPCIMWEETRGLGGIPTGIWTMTFVPLDFFSPNA